MLRKHLQILFISIILLVITTLLATSLPFQLRTPAWYIRLGELSVSWGISLLLALMILLIARAVAPDEEADLFRKKQIQIFTRIVGIFYVAMIPIQLASGIWQNNQTMAQVQDQIKSATAKYEDLRSKVLGSSSPEQLQKTLNIPLPPDFTQSSFTENKSTISERISTELDRTKSNIITQKNAATLQLFLTLSRTILGSTILGLSMLTINKSFKNPILRSMKKEKKRG
jgi:hypothetical protein